MNLPPLAVGAIVAAFVTGLISLLGLVIAKEHKVSEFRQAWIDELRTEIALLISHANAIHGAHVAGFSSASEAWQTVREDFVAINTAVAKIRLRLNPGEPESQVVLGAIEKLESELSPGRTLDHFRLNAIEKEIVTVSQIVLKKEWVRVRSGELVYRFARWAAVVFFMLVMASLLVAVVVGLVRSPVSSTIHRGEKPPASAVEIPLEQPN